MTTIDRTTIDDIAQRLFRAGRDAAPIAPPTDELPDLDVAAAYRIQQVNFDRAVGSGARLVGRKIGLTSAPMQTLLGVDEPDYGYVLDTMVVPDGGSIARATLCAPRVEPEIAFRLGRPLRGPGIDKHDVLDATDAVAAALEIVDSRIVKWRITLPDTVADNASSAAVVIGAWTPLEQVPALDAVEAELSLGGAVIDQGLGSAVLGHPAEAVAWLINALAEHDTGVDAGEFVMSGSMTSAAFVNAGDTAHAHLTGLGRVSVSFT
ncbi:2-keto-4-pentenoate hydratase [Rhodococcoides corynebacterioides]|uniref:2-keto-4-pentenoate hydratase n=1 Tax=Rhodococcoides corynebacterioides TaxID=53972 RepID=UPI0027E0620B|nr:fumarylacetoacetate hydrolase family protein [Rhodococcus corynebacterioides]